MKRSAAQLKASQRQGDEQKLKTTLGEISSLEAMLAAMRQASREEKVSPGELAALAAALAASDAAKGAGESIKQGQFEQAGDQLEKLAEQMKAQGDGAQALQQLAQSMQEQAAKLGEQEKTRWRGRCNRPRNLRRADRRNSARRPCSVWPNCCGGTARAAARDAKHPVSLARGSPMSEKQLQDLLNSLENMKEGLQPGGEGQTPGSPGDGQEGNQSLALVESFAKKGGGDLPDGQQPTGMPGSEHDQGTNDHLFAERAAEGSRSEGPARRLEGILGDGASLQELVGARADAARASRPYRNLYEAIAPAEQNSVEQEDIPLGSRFFVRRYFENIRPAN